MSDFFQPIHILILSSCAVVYIIPHWQIFKRAGFAPALSILVLVPLVGLIVLYYVAFSDWKTGASYIAPSVPPSVG